MSRSSYYAKNNNYDAARRRRKYLDWKLRRRAKAALATANMAATHSDAPKPAAWRSHIEDEWPLEICPELPWACLPSLTYGNAPRRNTDPAFRLLMEITDAFAEDNWDCGSKGERQEYPGEPAGAELRVPQEPVCVPAEDDDLVPA
jgi:hypothetical protein